MGLLLDMGGRVGFQLGFWFCFVGNGRRMMNGIDSVTGVLLKGPQTFIGVYSCRDTVSII